MFPSVHAPDGHYILHRVGEWMYVWEIDNVAIQSKMNQQGLRTLKHTFAWKKVFMHAYLRIIK